MNSLVLDVGIGLAFVFLLTSIVCSGLQELIGGWIDLRGKMLVRGLQSMLDARPTSGQSFVDVDLTGALMRHAMIKSLRNGKRWPSYLEPRTFALVLLDVLAKRYRSGQWLFDDVAQTVAVLPEGDLKQRLELIVREARGDSEKAKALIEQWYSETMDRVSGWYKRQAKLTLIALGFILAAVLNVDALHIANRLSSDSALRQALVASASRYVSERAAPASDGAAAGAAAEQVRTAVQQIVDLKLPIGYGADWQSGRSSTGFWLYFWMVCGWIITALAVSIGAPMWFDLLSKLLSLRSAGAKPAVTGLQADGPNSLVLAGARVPDSAPPNAALSGVGWSTQGTPGPSFAAALNAFEAEHLSRSDVRSLQTALRLEPSGLLEQATRDAISRVQKANGMAPNGELDAKLLQTILA